MHKAALNNKLKPNFYLYLRRSESKLDLKIKNKIMVAANPSLYLNKSATEFKVSSAIPECGCSYYH